MNNAIRFLLRKSFEKDICVIDYIVRWKVICLLDRTKKRLNKRRQNA